MDRIFLIYRYYPEADKKSQTHLHAWTESKAALKAFMSQRNEEKYRVKVLEDPIDIDAFGQSIIHPEDTMINTIMLQSHGTNEEIPFMITREEQQDAEQKILNMFKKAADLDITKVDRDDLESLIWMITNFLPIYDEAVNNIGYRPEILDSMFDDGLLREIPQAGMLPSTTVYYSLESIIKVMIDYL